MDYISTRGDRERISGAQAIVRGLAPDRGLYVPTSFPDIDVSADFDAAALAGGGYRGIAKLVLAAFLPDFTAQEIEACVDGAYDRKFDAPDIAPLFSITKDDAAGRPADAHVLELWHGPTAAFKDMALTILPYLMKTAARKTGEDKKIVILTATSGDTGKAALAGFADVPGTEIFVYYPKDGVSAVQERQMVTQEGGNVHVFGIRGNFDDAQTAVKNVSGDAAYGAALAARGVRLSSANSINIGRLVPQVAYYVSAWARLAASGAVGPGEPVNICVPTGNFGNILAAWYAKQIGVPVGRLICASNENKVLTDFLRSGVYDRRRDFVLTDSPSMDILISSNLERLLWHLSGGVAAGADGDVRRMMGGLDADGYYDAGEAVRQGLEDSRFYGGFADMERAHGALASLWQGQRYLIDTHTAVACAVMRGYWKETGDRTPVVIASTASPYKFAGSVARVLGLAEAEDEFAAVRQLFEYTGVAVPEGLRDLESKPVLHEQVIEREGVRATIDAALAG
ncbi:MAG: threonine synthase [Clostridiales Family XIII bacterium]|jgi:threonine synthase|nr:threonine synthase [Clostridiales Family XIII bacterium]